MPLPLPTLATPATSPTPSQQLADQSLDHSWPMELQQWFFALKGAEEAFSNLDDLECQAAKDRDMSRHELREIVALARLLATRINAAGSDVLGQWDENSCSWRKVPR